MGLSRTVFLSSEERAKKWQAVAKSNYFAEVLTFAKAELMDSPDVDKAQLDGARKLETILLTISDIEGLEQSQFVGSGLHHDLETSTRPNPSKPKPD